jgi:hypothetical protein
LAKQNAVTKLSMELPQSMKELKKLEEVTTRLRYQIEQFENPIRLIELAKSHSYSHLKHPTSNDVVVLPVSPFPEVETVVEERVLPSKPLFVIGASHN